MTTTVNPLNSKIERGLKGENTMLLTIVLIVLVLLLLGLIPAWPYSRDFGWGPSGILGLLLVIGVIAWLLGAFN